jgi:hypothetical protein
MFLFLSTTIKEKESVLPTSPRESRFWTAGSKWTIFVSDHRGSKGVHLATWEVEPTMPTLQCGFQIVSEKFYTVDDFNPHIT